MKNRGGLAILAFLVAVGLFSGCATSPVFSSPYKGMQYGTEGYRPMPGTAADKPAASATPAEPVGKEPTSKEAVPPPSGVKTNQLEVEQEKSDLTPQEQKATWLMQGVSMILTPLKIIGSMRGFGNYIP